MAKKGHELVKVIMDEKVWVCTRKMANNIIALGKQKYQKLNVNAIVAIEKNDMIVLQKDVYESAEEMLDSVVNWMNGKYSVYYVTKKENGGK